ncbi:hypothetical protein [Serratia marcescens]|uniref:hypothetical protein n=1 Tax=Serratia marcescens TaxID=615 RepID=UPI0011F341FE|nr:hypothetical protein [Serratia marcescens]
MTHQLGGLNSLLTSHSTPTGLSSGLGLGVYKMPEMKNAWYNNQDIIIDGWTFISCRFDNCRLYVSTGNFKFESCFIDDSTVVHFQNNALSIIQLLNRSNAWVRENYPVFAPSLNPDGTITVGG